jgi:hypothetical protein
MVETDKRRDAETKRPLAAEHPVIKGNSTGQWEVSSEDKCMVNGGWLHIELLSNTM